MIHSYITVSYLHLKHFFFCILVHVCVQIIKWGFRKNLILFTKKNPQTSKTAAYKVCQERSHKPKNDKIP